MAETLGVGKFTLVVEPTAAVCVTPVPLSQVYSVQSQAGAETVTEKLTVTAV